MADPLESLVNRSLSRGSVGGTPLGSPVVATASSTPVATAARAVAASATPVASASATPLARPVTTASAAPVATGARPATTASVPLTSAARPVTTASVTPLATASAKPVASATPVAASVTPTATATSATSGLSALRSSTTGDDHASRVVRSVMATATPTATATSTSSAATAAKPAVATPSSSPLPAAVSSAIGLATPVAAAVPSAPGTTPATSSSAAPAARASVVSSAAAANPATAPSGASAAAPSAGTEARFKAAPMIEIPDSALAGGYQSRPISAPAGQRPFPVHLPARRSAHPDALDERDRAELYQSQMQENLELRKHHASMSKQLKQLQVKLSQIQGDAGKEGVIKKHERVQQLEQFVASAGKQPSRGRRQRLQSQRAIGGVLRGRMAGVPVGMDAGPIPLGGQEPPMHAMSPVQPRHGRPAPLELPGSPVASHRPMNASMPLSPQKSMMGSMMSHSNFGDAERFEEVEHLKRQIKDLNEDNDRQKKRLNEVLSSKGDAQNELVSEMERVFDEQKAKAYRDKMKEKEGYIRQLEDRLQSQRNKAEDKERQFNQELQKVEIEIAGLQGELKLRNEVSGDTKDVSPLRQKLYDLQEVNQKLTAEIRNLTRTAFMSKEHAFKASNKRLAELEEKLSNKDRDVQKIVKDRTEVDSQTREIESQVKNLEERCKDVVEENERFRVQLDEKQKVVNQVEQQLHLMHESFAPEELSALERSLRAIADYDTAAALAGSTTMSAVDGRIKAVGEADKQSIEAMTRKIDTLRAQKEEVAQEVRAATKILDRESKIQGELKTLHQKDVDEIRRRIQEGKADADRWKSLSKTREKQIADLQALLAKKRGQAQPAKMISDAKPDQRPRDVVSEAGFSDLSELTSGENALDLYLTQARLEQNVALHELPKHPGMAVSDASLMSLVVVEFMDFDVTCSQVAGSLQPRYDSLLSFGPFKVDDNTIEHFDRGHMRLELQAFAIGGAVPHPIGQAVLPLVCLLDGDDTANDPNPMVTGTLSFVGIEDSRLQVATVQYKLRLRHPIYDKVRAYTQRRKEAAAEVKLFPDADRSLMDTRRGLLIQIFTVSLQVPAGRTAETMKPYVFYEVPNYRQHFTKTMSGNQIKFEDYTQITVRVDPDFCRWLDSDGLNFVVFDDAPPAQGATQGSEQSLGVLGEVKIALGKLLKDPHGIVQGNYELRVAGTTTTAATGPVGTIDVCVRWQDAAAALLPGRAPLTTVAKPTLAILSDERYQIVWLRVNRRLHVQRKDVTDWFLDHDTNKDGFWSRGEALTALSRMPLGLSMFEMEHVVDRLDRSKNQKITEEDVRFALAEGDRATPLELWARDIFWRIADAIRRRGQSEDDVFLAYTTPENRSIRKEDFIAIISSLDCGLTPDQIERLWQISDSNADGQLDYFEFAQRFRREGYAAAGEMQQTTAYTAPKGAVPKAKAAAKKAAVVMSEDWLQLCFGRILRSFAGRGLHGVERALGDLPPLITNVILRGFCGNYRALLSDMEVDQIILRLDVNNEKAIELRELQDSLRLADVTDAPHKRIEVWAENCLGRARATLIRQRRSKLQADHEKAQIEKKKAKPDHMPEKFIELPPEEDDVRIELRKVLESVVKTAPLQLAQHDLATAMAKLGVNFSEHQRDEFWWASDKTRDHMLELEAFFDRFVKAVEPKDGDEDEMTDEKFALVMGRMKKALNKAGIRTAMEAFERFDTNKDGHISAQEFDAGLAQLVKTISRGERLQVLRKVDTSNDNRINLKEFQKAMEKGLETVPAIERWAEDIFEKIGGALAREQYTVEGLFTALSQDGQTVMWPEFEGFFGRLDPGLTFRQLRRLWNYCDKDKDGGMDLSEFQRCFPERSKGASPKARSTPATKDEIRVQALASRVGRYLQRNKLSVQSAFVLYDKAADGTLDIDQWIQACRHHQLPLSEEEMDLLQIGLAVRGKMQLRTLQQVIERAVAQGVPEERWAREVVTKANAIATRGGGQPLSHAFGDREVVEEAAIRRELGLHLPLPDGHWARLQRLLDRRHDGLVLWQDFLSWACGPAPETGAPAGKGLSDDDYKLLLRKIRTKLDAKNINAEHAFKRFDTDGDGSLGASEWERFLATMPLGLGRDEMRMIFARVDSDNSGSISWLEFHKAMENDSFTAAELEERQKWLLALVGTVAQKIQDSGSNTRSVFEKYAVKTATGDHVITRAKFFGEFGPAYQLSELQLSKMFALLDKDANGDVDFEEFLEQFGPAAAARSATGVSVPTPKAKAKEEKKDDAKTDAKSPDKAASKADAKSPDKKADADAKTAKADAEAKAKSPAKDSPKKDEKKEDKDKKEDKGKKDEKEKKEDKDKESAKGKEGAGSPKKESEAKVVSLPESFLLFVLRDGCKQKGQTVQSLFTSRDKAQTGVISRDECKKLFQETDVIWAPEELESLLDHLDQTTGQVKLEKFMKAVAPGEVVSQPKAPTPKAETPKADKARGSLSGLFGKGKEAQDKAKGKNETKEADSEADKAKGKETKAADSEAKGKEAKAADSEADKAKGKEAKETEKPASDKAKEKPSDKTAQKAPDESDPLYEAMVCQVVQTVQQKETLQHFASAPGKLTKDEFVKVVKSSIPTLPADAIARLWQHVGGKDGATVSIDNLLSHYAGAGAGILTQTSSGILTQTSSGGASSSQPATTTTPSKSTSEELKHDKSRFTQGIFPFLNTPRAFSGVWIAAVTQIQNQQGETRGGREARIPWDRLHSILDNLFKGAGEKPLDDKELGKLFSWLPASSLGEDQVLWPSLGAFAVNIEKVRIRADSAARKAYDHFYFSVHFGGQVVQCPQQKPSWGLSTPFSKTTWNDKANFSCEFFLDGSQRLGPEELGPAFRTDAAAQQVEVVLFGIKAGHPHRLGVQKFSVLDPRRFPRNPRDNSILDMQATECPIASEVPGVALGCDPAHGLKVKLEVFVTISTHNARRLWGAATGQQLF